MCVSHKKNEIIEINKLLHFVGQKKLGTGFKKLKNIFII